MVCGDGGRAARRRARRLRRDGRQPRAGLGRRAVHADGARRPHRRQGRGLVITDYKTGSAQRCSRQRAGARRSCRSKPPSHSVTAGFPASRHARVEALRYIRASGGEPPGEERSVRGDDIAATGRRSAPRPRASHRRIRRPGHALPGAAPAALQLRLRRLCASRPRRRMVGARRGGGGVMNLETQKAARRRSPADAPPSAERRRRPARLGLGQRQRRHRQDARADAARAAPAAGRHAARAHPLPHLHEGRRRRDVEARVRHAGRVGDGRRRDAQRKNSPKSGDRLLSDAEMDCARTLFAIAIETPGGLKVQTIHAFCERCCSASRWRPACRRVSPSSTKRRRATSWPKRSSER